MAEAEAGSVGRGGLRWPAILGLVLLALALLDLGFWLVTALGTGSWRLLAAGEVWFRIDVSSLNLVQAVIQRYVYPPLWDPVLIDLLQWPFWVLFGLPGAVLVALFARRRAP